MRKSMAINNTSAERAYKTLKIILTEYEAMAEGEFFVGDQLSIADVSFAALTAPLVLPPKYGATLPTLEELPKSMIALVQEFQDMEAGKRALRLYTQYRASTIIA